MYFRDRSKKLDEKFVRCTTVQVHRIYMYLPVTSCNIQVIDKVKLIISKLNFRMSQERAKQSNVTFFIDETFAVLITKPILTFTHYTHHIVMYVHRLLENKFGCSFHMSETVNLFSPPISSTKNLSFFL